MTELLELPPGLHSNVPERVYHARMLGIASKSLLDEVRRSPKHYLEAVHGPLWSPTPAMIVGTALHCAVFEPARFETAYACEPDFGDCRQAANKRARNEWRAAHEGRIPLSDKDLTAVLGMARALREHPVAGRMLVGGEGEVTLRWRDPETGIECKGRLDYLRRDLRLAADLKSTDDVGRDAFTRTVARFRYHRQEAMYREAGELLGAFERFAFVAVERDPPHDVAVRMLGVKSIAKGRATIRADLRTLAECIAADRWPGCSDEIETIEIPDWSE